MFEAHQREGEAERSHRRWRIWILYPPVLLGVGGKREPEGDHADNDGHFATEREHCCSWCKNRIAECDILTCAVAKSRALFRQMLVLLYAS